MIAAVRGRAVGAVAAILIGFAGMPAVAHAAPAVGARPLSGRSGVLNAVHAVARGNVWAGGYSDPITRPMLFHKRLIWHPQTVPGVAAPEVFAIDATSARDVWAVGDGIYHWNGVRWRKVSAPMPNGGATYYSIAALSRSNAWAVGGYLNEGSELERTLIAHWNGHTWQRVRSPSNGAVDLDSVSFASANEGWAVGELPGPDEIYSMRLMLHWDGTHWTRVRLPHAMGATHSLVAVSKRDVWAVGASIWHYDGTHWRRAAYPLRRKSTFTAVDSYAANGVWVIGRTCKPHRGCHSLALRWDGTRWTRTLTPNAARDVWMTGVSAFGPANVWAVGYDGPVGHERAVVLHWTGHRWHVA